VTAEIATAITANTEEGTVLNFGALPPEINSTRIYSGPGSEPMMVAAAAWDELAAELDTAASNYGSVIDELTSGPWVGPTSASMVSAVVPFLTWLSALTSQAEQTAGQARAAAAAFETAFAMTVPPPVIAANRVLLMTLIATNFFGQNTPAIAATEAQYMQMWAQDAAAMYSYAGSSAAASDLTVFTSPPNTAAPDAESEQFAAVQQASSTPAGNSAQTAASAISQAAPAAVVPQNLSQLEAAIYAEIPWAGIETQLQNLAVNGILPTPTNNWLQLAPGDYTAIIKQTLQAYFGVGVGSFGFQIGQQLTFGLGSTAGSGAWYATPQYAGLHLGALGGLGANTAGSVSANLGSSAQVGGLSVPAGWASSSGGLEASATRAVEVNALAAARPDGFGGAGGAGENGLLRGMPMAGAGAGRRGAVATAFTNKYGFKRSVLVRPPSAG
jgi:PPE-repeat protein